MIVGSEEIYRKISSQIESQFPDFIRTEGPKFVEFMKLYYEFMEQEGNVLDASRGLPDYNDIDRTLDAFIERFQREYMANIPRDIQANKRLLVKYIREFYNTRGSQESYRFLFRILFNEEIDFYYPGEDILRASDGRWVQETVIRGRPVAGNYLLLDGREITGQSSGAKARVQELLTITASGLPLIQLRIENVIGTFQEDEIVSDGLGNSIRVFNAAGSIESVVIVRGGALHETGDAITLAGENGGTATGTITSTTDTSAVTFRIQNGGSGYRIANTVLTLSGGDPTVPAQLSIVNLSNTESVNICSDIILPVKDVVLNSVPFGAGNPAFTVANVNSTLQDALTFANVTIGSINTIALINPGSGYTGSLPSVTAVDSEIASQNITDAERGGLKGQNAVIIASRLYGSVVSVSIDSSDINFLKNDNITLTNIDKSAANTTDISTDTYGGISRGLIRKGVFPATVTAEIKGTFDLPGRYIDTKGFLSWNNRLQDNDYYQEFSYVINAKRLLNEYRETILRSVHPAGTKLFGTVMSDNSVDFSQYADNGSLLVQWERKHANNVININTSPYKTMRLTVGPFWLNDGSITNSHLWIVPVSNTSASNGMYQVNAISNSSQLTLKNGWEHQLLTNGYFYYVSSANGSI